MKGTQSAPFLSLSEMIAKLEWEQSAISQDHSVWEQQQQQNHHLRIGLSLGLWSAVVQLI